VRQEDSQDNVLSSLPLSDLQNAWFAGFESSWPLWKRPIRYLSPMAFSTNLAIFMSLPYFVTMFIHGNKQKFRQTPWQDRHLLTFAQSSTSTQSRYPPAAPADGS